MNNVDKRLRDTNAREDAQNKLARNDHARNEPAWRNTAANDHVKDSHAEFRTWFGKAAARAAGWVGDPWAFSIAFVSVLVWAASGPYFRYSNTWQLIINTATTVITFLIVFLIQNTQNRDARALHLKLDEVIRSIHSAHNEMINIEKLSDPELEELTKRYERFSAEWKLRHRRRHPAG
jgi:low affinity Fe/Cu permease